MPAKYLIIRINPRERFDDLKIFKYIHHADPDQFPKSVLGNKNTVVSREDAKEWVKEWQMDRADTASIKAIKDKYEDGRGMVLTRTKWALRLADKKGTLIKAGLSEKEVVKLVDELVDAVYDKYKAESNVYIKGNNVTKNKKIYEDEDGATVFDFD